MWSYRRLLDFCTHKLASLQVRNTNRYLAKFQHVDLCFFFIINAFFSLSSFGISVNEVVGLLYELCKDAKCRHINTILMFSIHSDSCFLYLSNPYRVWIDPHGFRTRPPKEYHHKDRHGMFAELKCGFRAS